MGPDTRRFAPERQARFVAALIEATPLDWPETTTAGLRERIGEIRALVTVQHIEGLGMTITADTHVSSIDWPTDTGAGPEGIVEACKALGIQTLGELHRLIFSPRAYLFDAKVGNYPPRRAAARAILTRHIGGPGALEAGGPTPPLAAQPETKPEAPAKQPQTAVPLKCPQLSVAGIRAGRTVASYRMLNKILRHLSAGLTVADAEASAQAPTGYTVKWAEKLPAFKALLAQLPHSVGLIKARPQAPAPKPAPTATPARLGAPASGAGDVLEPEQPATPAEPPATPDPPAPTPAKAEPAAPDMYITLPGGRTAMVRLPAPFTLADLDMLINDMRGMRKMLTCYEPAK